MMRRVTASEEKKHTKRFIIVFQNKVQRRGQKARGIRQICLLFLEFVILWKQNKLTIESIAVLQFKYCLESACYLFLLVASKLWCTQ